MAAEGSNNRTIISTSELTDRKYLDQGAYGKVFSATYQNRRVAMKVLRAEEDDKNEDKDWKSEAELLQSVDHPYILSILGVVDNLVEKELWIITELLDGGNLRPYCTGAKTNEMTTVEKTVIGFQCWSGLSYLHNVANIRHKDIKPENILLTKVPEGKLEARICDFGLAKLKDAMATTANTKITGTAMYFPPELASGRLHPRKGDVYSLGATLIELFTNLWTWHEVTTLKLIEHMRVMTLLAKIEAKTSASSPVDLADLAPLWCNAVSKLDGNHCKMVVVDILKRTVNYDRNERPTAAEVLVVFENALSK